MSYTSFTGNVPLDSDQKAHPYYISNECVHQKFDQCSGTCPHCGVVCRSDSHVRCVQPDCPNEPTWLLVTRFDSGIDPPKRSMCCPDHIAVMLAANPNPHERYELREFTHPAWHKVEGK
jgi:hypothetical protein